MSSDNQLMNYLEWLITPQDEDEATLFKSENLVDDYIGLKKKLSSLSRVELIKEINIQLAPYGLEINDEPDKQMGKQIVLIPCESGRYLAWYKHREDIVANGETEIEATDNLKLMYQSVMEYESKEIKPSET